MYKISYRRNYAQHGRYFPWFATTTEISCSAWEILFFWSTSGSVVISQHRCTGSARPANYVITNVHSNCTGSADVGEQLAHAEVLILSCSMNTQRSLGLEITVEKQHSGVASGLFVSLSLHLSCLKILNIHFADCIYSHLTNYIFNRWNWEKKV